MIAFFFLSVRFVCVCFISKHDSDRRSVSVLYHIQKLMRANKVGHDVESRSKRVRFYINTADYRARISIIQQSSARYSGGSNCTGNIFTYGAEDDRRQWV